MPVNNIEDGNEFKIGGFGKDLKAKSKLNGGVPPVHIVKNCISANNKANGFYANHQPGQAAIWFNNRAYNNKANFVMTDGSEKWEVDSSGKVVDICGTREVLWFNIAHIYSSGLLKVCMELKVIYIWQIYLIQKISIILRILKISLLKIMIS